jgi:hypothetical protein
MWSPTVLGGFEKGFGLNKLMRTRWNARKAMDEWGYNFRLGSTRAWFEQDADDGRDWLRRLQLADETDVPRMRRREH